MKGKHLIATAVLAALLLPACKPSEKNYQAAYDMAQAKRQKEATDPDIAIPAGALSQDGAPRMEVVEGDTVLVQHRNIKLIDGPGPLLKYNVVIASYKMTANARAHWESLVKTFPSACLLQESSQVYLVSIGGFKHKKEAARVVFDYVKAHPDFHYVGLTQEFPVIYDASNISSL